MLDNIMMLVTRYGDVFVDGIYITLLLAAETVFFGTILGSFVCLCKMSKFKPLSLLATAYVEVIRGTPLLVQLFFFYFMLPNISPIDLDKFTSVAVALALNSAGYIAEIVRSGIQAVDKGQVEAARSLGLNGKQTMIKVVLPQAVKNILPTLGNEFIMVIKETSLASTLFVGDLMTRYQTVKSATYMTIEPLLIVAAIYFMMTFTLSKLIAVFERRLGNSD